VADARLASAAGAQVYADLLPDIRDALLAVDDQDFAMGDAKVCALRAVVDVSRVGVLDDDDYLQDLFVMDCLVDLVERYCHVWSPVISGDFTGSWNLLQDALDAIRCVKRFSGLDVSYFERELHELEDAYPYKVFFSIGAQVGHFECSICGQDIDSTECAHRRGQLYHGVMAHGIAHDMVSIDHVSMVTDPADKRCVVGYENAAPEFQVIRYLADQLASSEFRVSNFDKLDWTEERRPNPDYVNLGRNDPCCCGSGKKFKRCCIDQREIPWHHVQVVLKSRDTAAAVV